MIFKEKAFQLAAIVNDVTESHSEFYVDQMTLLLHENEAIESYSELNMDQMPSQPSLVRAKMTLDLQGGIESQDASSLQVIFRKRAL